MQGNISHDKKKRQENQDDRVGLVDTVGAGLVSRAASPQIQADQHLLREAVITPSRQDLVREAQQQPSAQLADDKLEAGGFPEGRILCHGVCRCDRRGSEFVHAGTRTRDSAAAGRGDPAYAAAHPIRSEEGGSLRDNGPI